MKFRSLLSEAMRNISCGTAGAAALMLAVLFGGTLLGGWEAWSVIELEGEAESRIAANADVKTVLGSPIDGVACDRLSRGAGDSGLSQSGAMRAGQQVTPLSTPGRDIASYEVTAGMLGLLVAGDANATVDASGVWVSNDVAQDFGLVQGSRFETDCGIVRVAGVFDWPNDGRDTRFTYAIITPVSASGGTFEECWAKQWPASDQLDMLLYSTVISDGGSSQSMAGVTQLNKGFDSHYDAQSSYALRMTRWMPFVGVGIGLLIGVVAVRRRRLEYAGALHVGQTKGAQLLGIMMETLVWNGGGLICSTALLTALAMRWSPGSPELVLLAAVRTPLAIFAAVMLASLATGLTIRESQLFRYFKNR